MITPWRTHRRRRTRPRRRPSAASDAHYRAHRASARAVLVARVEALSAQHGFTYNRIAIRNTLTRWGSCSSRKNINLHYGLAFLPPSVRDYVIVHELCHLRELHHGAAFWARVAQIMPDYRTHRRALRAYAPHTIVRMTHMSPHEDFGIGA